MLLTGNNPLFAVLVIGVLLAAIIFGYRSGERTKLVVGGVIVAAVMIGLALLADAFM